MQQVTDTETRFVTGNPTSGLTTAVVYEINGRLAYTVLHRMNASVIVNIDHAIEVLQAAKEYIEGKNG